MKDKHPPRNKKGAKEYTGYNMPPAQAERIADDLKKESERKTKSQSAAKTRRKKDHFEK